MAYTNRFSEGACLLAKIDPDSYAAAEYNTGWVLMENYHRAAVVIHTGDMAAGATLDCDLEEGIDATGSTRANLKSITQLTQAGGDANDTVIIEFQTEEFDVDAGYEYLNVEVTVGTDAVDFVCELWGIEPRYPPVPTTLVTEVVA
jgi:hypothetical protein